MKSVRARQPAEVVALKRQPVESRRILQPYPHEP